MLPIIIIITSIILDGLLTNYLPYLVNDLTLFTPMLTLVTIFIIYPFYRKKIKKYYLIVFIIGITYDLLYTNLLFFNAILFLIIAYISRFIHKNYEVTYLRIIIYIPVLIIVYESLTALIILIFNLVPITFERLYYKITHSLLLNIIYVEIITLIINLLPNKFKKISIN